MIENATTRKTLMASLENLDSTAHKYEDLARCSEILLYKFERTPVDTPQRDVRPDKMAPESAPDLIDLFNRVNNRLENALSIIERNLEIISCMVE